MSISRSWVKQSASSKEEKINADILIKTANKHLSGKALNNLEIPVQEAPLTLAQQKIWFAQAKVPYHFAFNTTIGITISGALNQTALEKSLQAVAQRQHILKTTFATVAGKVSQKVSAEIKFNLQTKDFSSFSFAQAKEELNEFIQEQARLPFDLENEPLVRPFLARLAEQEHVLLLCMHQLIIDRSSTPILLQELAQVYGALNSHSYSSLILPEMQFQYADYAYWQQDYIKQLQASVQADYWKKQLQGDLPLLELPTDKLRPAVKSFNGSAYSFNLPEKVSYGLKDLAEKNGTSFFTVLLACFYTLIYRYTGQEDIIIGTPVYNRSLEGVKNVIGLFRHLLPLRQQINGELTFIKLLLAIHDTVSKALQHKEISFENITEESKSALRVSNSLTYQVLFELQNKPVDPLKADTVTFEEYELHSGISEADLFLSVRDLEDAPTCVFRYDADMFNADTIGRMATHFISLTQSIVTDNSQKIVQLTILTEAEQNLLLVEWNKTKVDYPADKCVHQLFEEQAEKTPEAIAIVFEDTQLTYSQLNERANQLAHYLQNKGVAPQTKVGICVDRSLELIIGLLGILKAGGAFVPLDTNYPKERLLFMLEDTEVTVLLTQKKLENYFPGIVCQTILLDEDWQKITKESTTNPQNSVQADDRLYVMYTSGSTGKPKGVSTLDKGVVRLVKNTNYVHLDEQEVLLQYAPVTFDASTFEIWGSLLNGGKLIIMLSGATTLEELKHTIKNHKVTTLWLSAGLFHLMVDNGIEELNSLRQLLAGGEALSINHVRKAYQHLKTCKIINGYGPTENTTFTCCYEVTEKGLSRNSVPIGRPINNTTVYVLDKYLKPVPIGVAGELYTGGDGLARNYLNRPDLTAEKFLPNPFISEPNEYLYKTGDLVRYLPDGNIEFLGRIDTQVKIRGFRIELGEIEAILGKHAQVKESVVIVREDIPGDKRIVAYVVPTDNSLLDTALLQEYLKKQMPAYMIPSGTLKSF